MKYFKSVLRLMIALIVLFLYSCEKESLDSTQNTITDEISKVVTIYQEGNVKVETIADKNSIKNETSASDSFKEKLREELDKSFTKQTTYLKSAGNTVGVIKSGSCGSYSELYWHMDCEDINNISSKSGWFGDCTVNNSGNIEFHFCVVNGAYFERTNVDFAVLNLTGSSNWPYDVSRICMLIDNEDNNNINSSSTNGVTQPGWIGDCDFYYDTRLSFYYYPHTTGSRYFPNLGISYGVFGQFDSNQGSIFTDDEDANNDNWIVRNDFNSSTWTLETYYYVSGVSNIVAASGVNTVLYASKVN